MANVEANLQVGRNVSARRLSSNVCRDAAKIASVGNYVYLSGTLSKVNSRKAYLNASGANHCNKDRVGKVSRDRCPFARFRLIKVAGQRNQRVLAFCLSGDRIDLFIHASGTPLGFAIIVRFRRRFIYFTRRVIVNRGMAVDQSGSAKANSFTFKDLGLASLHSATSRSRRVSGRVYGQILRHCHLHFAIHYRLSVCGNVREDFNYYHRVRRYQ